MADQAAQTTRGDPEATRAAMYRLLPWRHRVLDTLEPELVAMAAEVAAAARSAQAALAGVPDGPERQRLMDICDQLERAANHLLDPRRPVQHFSGVRAEEEFDDFMRYQERAASIRAAARKLAKKRDRPWRIFRSRQG